MAKCYNDYFNFISNIGFLDNLLKFINKCKNN